ncbi:MAG: RNA pseudouridine synthase [Verrucomicrobia bacterium]|nr:MAG: RNA pseudouridine synthase [Verrucomicrobiota bacterium]
MISDPREIPFGPDVTVLRMDPCGLIAVDKPAGILSHPNRPGEKARAVVAADYDERAQCYRWSGPDGAERRLWLLHRLDSATSGVLLLAADPAVAEAAKAAFKARTTQKKYLAIVAGHPRERRAEWRDTMAVKRGRGQVRAASGGGVTAITAMRLIRLIPGPPALAVVALEPRTGRTHQLRFQCARRQIPILGDQTYGNFRLNRDLGRRLGTDRLFLHAASISLEFALGGRRHRFSAAAPEPDEFVALARRR